MGWEGGSRGMEHMYVLCCAVSLSPVWLFVTPWTIACQASLSITNSWSLPKLMSIENMDHWKHPRDLQDSSPTPQLKSINALALRFLYSPTLTSIHDYWKNQALTRRTFVGKVMSLLFNILSILIITFLPRSKHLLISWLQSPSAVILEPPKIKSDTVSLFPHLSPMKWWDQMPWS